MKITRGDNPLNLIVNPNFRLKQMGFSEWLEVHALASKKSAKRLGLLSPPELATFGLTAEEKKRKRTEFIKEMFMTEYVRVDGINRNLIPPPRIMPIQGLVINAPESGIFTHSVMIWGGTDIVEDYHITSWDGYQVVCRRELVKVLRRVRGGNTLTIMLPSEEEQAELKDCSLMKARNLTSVYGGINIGLS
ncbi:hypothetical protein Tco_0837565 [Tanacetum coccineum]